MRLLVYILTVVAIVGFGYHLYGARAVLSKMQAQLSSINESLGELKEDNKNLEEDIEYYSDPHNLEKELRSRFNYKAPNEKMIIVAPQSSE